MRVVLASAWVKALNSFSCTSAGMPIPVSATEKASSQRSTASGLPSIRTVTEPVSVNFSALPTRLVTICRSRRASPTSAAGTPSAVSTMSVRPLDSTRSRSNSAASVSSAAGAKGRWSMSMRPASILDRSSTSSMMAISDMADRWARVTCCSCSWVSRLSASNSSMPRTPFIGVRIS